MGIEKGLSILLRQPPARGLVQEEREEYRVKPLHFLPQSLGTEIGRGIDDNRMTVELQK